MIGRRTDYYIPVLINRIKFLYFAIKLERVPSPMDVHMDIRVPRLLTIT